MTNGREEIHGEITSQGVPSRSSARRLAAPPVRSDLRDFHLGEIINGEWEVFVRMKYSNFPRFTSRTRISQENVFLTSA